MYRWFLSLRYLRARRTNWIGAAGMNVKAIASVAGYKPPTLESITEENMASVYEGSELSAEMAAALAHQGLLTCIHKHATHKEFDQLQNIFNQLKLINLLIN